MLERIEKLQVLTVGLLIVLGILIGTKTLVTAFSGNVISVTGSAFEIVKSDSGSVSFNINVKRINKQEAYNALQTQIKSVEKYLTDKKITKIERKNINGYYNYKRDDRTGVYTNIPESYSISQSMTFSSDDVNLIKEISNDITGLISQGIDINVYETSYSYSKLPELKVALLEKASQDARARAESMLNATGNKVGGIKSVRMGVYQITPVNSTDVSDMGINDSSTIDKKVTAVANMSFKIK